jgi:hypothetical protein
LVRAELSEAGTDARDAESLCKLLGFLRRGVIYRSDLNARNRLISPHMTFTEKSAAHQPYSNSVHPFYLLASNPRMERVDDVVAVQDFLNQIKGTIIVVV